MKTWFNHQWLSRVMAISSWFSSGKPTVELAACNSGKLVVESAFLSLAAPFGIDEGLLDPVQESGEEDELTEEEGEGDEGGRESE